MLIGEGVSPENGLPYVDQWTPEGIQRRYLGRLPTPEGHSMMALPGLEAVTGISPIPRDKIVNMAFESRWTEVPILDQDGQGACTAYAHATAAMLVRSRAGSTFQMLSANFLYTLINGGFDGGSNAGDAIQAMTTTGIALASVVSGRPIRPKGVSSAAMASAARFRLRDSLRLTTIEEVWTCLAFRWPVTIDVQAGNAYNTDSHGTLAYLGNRNNHEQVLSGEGIRIGPDGKLQFLLRNSWNVTWGQNGFAWATEQHVLSSQMLFCPRWMIEDPQDPDVIPGLPKVA